VLNTRNNGSSSKGPVPPTRPSCRRHTAPAHEVGIAIVSADEPSWPWAGGALPVSSLPLRPSLGRGGITSSKLPCTPEICLLPAHRYHQPTPSTDIDRPSPLLPVRRPASNEIAVAGSSRSVPLTQSNPWTMFTNSITVALPRRHRVTDQGRDHFRRGPQPWGVVTPKKQSFGAFGTTWLEKMGVMMVSALAKAAQRRDATTAVSLMLGIAGEVRRDWRRGKKRRRGFNGLASTGSDKKQVVLYKKGYCRSILLRPAAARNGVARGRSERCWRKRRTARLAVRAEEKLCRKDWK